MRKIVISIFIVLFAAAVCSAQIETSPRIMSSRTEIARQIHDSLATHGGSYSLADNAVTVAKLDTAAAGWIDVRKFGATGDGVTDDTDAIQAAINYSNDVYFPAGRYLVTTINLDDNSSLLGSSRESSTICSAGNTIVCSGDSNISVRSLRFVGAGTKVELTISNDVSIENCKFDSVGAGISMTGINNISIINNIFQNTTYSGVYFADPDTNENKNVWIEGNYFSDCNSSKTTGHAAIQAYGKQSDDSPNLYVFINNNRVVGPGKVSFGLDRIDYSSVCGNRITGNSTAGEGISFTGTNNTIMGNYVSACGAPGIMLWLVNEYDCKRNIIADNVLWDNNNIGIAIVWGEDSTTVSDLTIKGNRCFDGGSGNQDYALQSYKYTGVVTTSWSDVKIFNNDFTGNVVAAKNLIDGGYVTKYNNLEGDGATSGYYGEGAVVYVDTSGVYTANDKFIYINPTTGYVSIGGSASPVGNLNINKTGSGGQSANLTFESNSTESARFGWSSSGYAEVASLIGNDDIWLDPAGTGDVLVKSGKLDVENGGVSSDSITVGAGGVWMRNFYQSGNDLGIIFYNSALSRIDTVFAKQP